MTTLSSRRAHSAPLALTATAALAFATLIAPSSAHAAARPESVVSDPAALVDTMVGT